MDSVEIIQLLTEPTQDRRPIMRRLVRKARIRDLIEALRECPEGPVRELLCDLLGEKKAKSALAVLLQTLGDRSPSVRASAADAIAKIHEAGACAALLEHLMAERDERVKQMIVLALGASGCYEAIPSLVEELQAMNATLRGCAAWSLSELGAESALPKLRAALDSEYDEYARERIKEAMRGLSGDGRRGER